MAKARNQQERLLRLGKATKKDYDAWKEGVSIVSDFGMSLIDLRLKIVQERWGLALTHRKEGRKLWTADPPPFRAIVSRYYYVMYHAMRSVVFFDHGGDDFEKHNTLPTKLPNDFPNVETWQNMLKNARLARNAADYDPYPKSDNVWKKDAEEITAEAEKLLAIARQYLRTKGCNKV